MESHRVTAAGVNLHVVTAGPRDGDVLVLLHGWPESHRAWQALVPYLEDEYRLVMPDQRGFGASDRPEGTRNFIMWNLVADVAALIDWTGAAPVGVVGHDFGSAVTWQVATMLPDRVRRAVCMAAPHPMHMRRAAAADPRQLMQSFYVWLLHAGPAGEALLAQRDFEFLSAWVFGGTDAVPPDLIAEYRRQWSQEGAFHAMAEWYRANFRPDLLNPDVPLDLPRVTVPVRYLHPERDPAFVPGCASGSGDFVDAEYDEQVVPGTTHWMVHERPDEIARLIRDWMRRG